MSISCRFVVATADSAESVAALAVPNEDERPTPEPPDDVLAADLYDRRGFALYIRAARDTYNGAADDDGQQWSWTPPSSVNLSFQMGDDVSTKGIPNMLAIVSRVVEGSPADLALVFNSDLLVLTRVGGRLVKHSRRIFWDHYDYADELVSG